jgi:histidinol dehydrogenase
VDCEVWEAPAGSGAETAAALRALVPAGASVREPVAEILGAVRARGDEAVRSYTRRFDTRGAEPRALRVEPELLREAAGALAPDVRDGLSAAIVNLRRVAEAGIREDRTVTLEAGHQVILREAPVTRAAVYVPGGRAPYPSTVLMGVVTARAAGVGEVAVCSPPGPDGEINAVVLGACHLAGAHVVYRMGGAQSIAALAYGTETVTAVDVIVGPGNLYTQEAKLQVCGEVAIDGFAGPSDLVVIADPGADPGPLSADLLAQAEHGEATIVVGLSSERRLLDALAATLRVAPDTGALARLVVVPDVDGALEIAQAFAPEHLELVGAVAQALAPRITRAGCVFVGPASATAFGDYVAGSNHVLPTGGTARFASSLSPGHFRRRFTEVRIGPAASALARAGAPVARAEGFEWHARSMEARMQDNSQL